MTAVTVDARLHAIAALRDAADFLDANPDFPAPLATLSLTVDYVSTREQFIAVARRIGATDVVGDDYIHAVRYVGGARFVVGIAAHKLAGTPAVDLDAVREQITGGGAS